MRKNLGFTMIELIVTVVILAVLVSVSVAGIFSYVSNRNVSADLQSIEAIEGIVNTFYTDEDLTQYCQGNKDWGIWIRWGLESTGDYNEDGSCNLDEYYTDYPYNDEQNARNIIVTKLKRLCPDGLPKIKSSNHHFIILMQYGGQTNYELRINVQLHVTNEWKSCDIWNTTDGLYVGCKVVSE